MKNLLTIVLAVEALSVSPALAATAATIQPVEYVNIFQGTDSTKGFSNGNTLPLVGMPWGMVAWSLENNSPDGPGPGGIANWFFTPNGKCYGFRATHQPSP